MKNTILVLAMFLFLGHCKTNEPEPAKKVIIGYIHVGDTILDGNTIEAEKLSHINFAFANIVGGKIAEGSRFDSVNYLILNKLKNRNQDLKILVSVGGWSWSDHFSEMAATPENRKKFIESTIRFAEKHKIDGIDLDWEYPGLPGEGNPFKPEDKQNFTSLLSEFRTALDELGRKNNRHYLLTIAAGAFQAYADNIEAEKIYPFLDYINLMTYDFCGEWDNKTGHLTNLFTPEQNAEAASCDKTLEIFLKAGVPSEKLVLGMAFYGRGWKEVPGHFNGLFQSGKGYNPGYTYRSICEIYNEQNGYKRFWDSSAMSPYIYHADSQIFISYEDTFSIRKKSEFIVNENMAGAMFWEYKGDYKGQLLQAISKNLWE